MQKRPSYMSYFMPFMLIGGIGIITVGSLLAFISQGIIPLHQKRSVIVETIQKDTEIKISGSKEWSNIGEKHSFRVQENEYIRTNQTGKAKLEFSSSSFAILGEQSEVYILQNNQDEKSAFIDTKVSLLRGTSYFSIERMINPKSVFTLTYDQTTFSTKGASYIIDNGILHVLKGEVFFTSLTSESSFSVGIGQSIPLNEASIIAENKMKTPGELSLSSFYIFIQNHLSNKPQTDNKESIIITETETPAAEVPQSLIIFNGVNEEGILLSNTEPVEIQGTVPSTTISVSVNNYTLSQYVPKSTSFIYRAKKEFGNLKDGENTYEVMITHEDKTTSTATLKVLFENKESENIKTSAQETVTTSPTPLAVIFPEQDSRIATDPVKIEGRAPKNAAKIQVNDYILRTYVPGSEKWVYNASQNFENLVPQSKNNFLIVAYDENDKELSTITLSFFSTAEPKVKE